MKKRETGARSYFGTLVRDEIKKVNFVHSNKHGGEKPVESVFKK